jgi:hypothetical protein
LTVIAFVAARVRAGFFSDHQGLNAIFICVGKMAYDVIALVAEGRLRGSTLLWQLAVWTPLAAVTTSAAGVLVFAVMRTVLTPRRVV